MNKDEYPAIQPGTRVRTTKQNTEMRGEMYLWRQGWGKRQWGVTGEVIGHHDSHGLYYDVKHPNGTIAGYDPSEIEVVMKNYLLAAKAAWTEYSEHPHGKSDIDCPQSKAFSITFKATDIEAARLEAQRLLAEFEQGLPKKREGSLSWQNEDAKIVSTTLALVLDM